MLGLEITVTLGGGLGLSRKSTGHLVSAVSVSATKEDLIYANHCRVGSMLSSGTEVCDVV
jgi:hypothetical protein